MTDIFSAAAEVQTFCATREWHFCFIGGIALLRWGEPRMTVDVDVTLLTGFGGEAPFIDALIERFPSRITDARSFAMANRILLLRSESGVALDIALGGLPFEEYACHRATDFEFSRNISLRTCNADDLIVMKAFANRPRDWLDIEGIIIRQGGQLDWQYIIAQLTPLCVLKDSPEIVDVLHQLRIRADQT